MTSLTNPPARPKTIIERLVSSESLLLAIVPLLAYALLFCYQLGFMLARHVPVEFMTFNVSDVFVVSFVLLILFVPLSFLAYALLDSFRTVPPPLNVLLPRTLNIFILLVLLLIVMISLTGSKTALGLILVFVGYFLGEYARPVWTQRGKGTYLQKLVAEEDRRRQLPDDAVTVLMHRIGSEVILAPYGLLIAVIIGRITALNQITFQIADSTPEAVVIWQTHEQVVIAPFDRVTKLVSPQFRIVNLGADPQLEFRTEDIGPLVYGSPVAPSIIMTPTAPPVLPTVSPSPATTQTPLPHLGPSPTPP
jgi:hypothetical protein